MSSSIRIPSTGRGISVSSSGLNARNSSRSVWNPGWNLLEHQKESVSNWKLFLDSHLGCTSSYRHDWKCISHHYDGAAHYCPFLREQSFSRLIEYTNDARKFPKDIRPHYIS
jgi:hypothetical protein